MASDNLLWMQNPQLANAARRRQEGAALMRQGMDTSPIQSPWQGVSRLAQALMGGYEARKGDEAITEAGDKRAKMLSDLFADDMPAPQPAPAAVGAALASPAPAGGAAPPQAGSSDLLGMVTPIAQKYGVPVSLAMALIQQESGGNPNAVGDGGQSVGLGQIQARTAQQPGYGVPPMDPARRNDPAANVDFALNYLTSKGRALGATDFNNPDHVDKALLAYNGGGDPNYVQNVRGRMGGGETMPVAAQGAPGAPAQPPAPDPMADVRRFQMQAQRAAAAGETGLASLFMQRAQMAQQAALARAPQPKNPIQIVDPNDPSKLIWVMPEAAVGQRAPDGRPLTNVTVNPNPPADHRAVYDPSGRLTHYEVIPESPTARKLAKEAEARGAKREGEVRTSNIVLEDIDRITKLMDTSILPTAGAGAGLASMIPGTGASDINKLLEGIKANIGFDVLSKMRAESPTGAALGAITERELAFLQAVRGSLDQAQSSDQFRFTLKRLRDGFAEIIHGPQWREVVGGAGDTTPAAAPGGGAGGEMPTITDPAEAARLPPGTQFRTPDGRTLRVPAR